MSLPPQVQAQLEEAERLQQQLVESQQPPQEPPQQEEGESQPDPQQEITPAPEPAPKQPESGEDVWERRYKTIQGKYNAEVPRLTAQVKDLSSQLERAISEIDAIKARAAEPVTPERPVTDKDVEVFGGDLIDLIDRKANEVAQKLVSAKTSKLEAENAKLREELSGVSERQVSNAQQMYFSSLAREVPDWEAINVDQGFMDWLAEADLLSGRTRQDYLTEAYQQQDAARTAALFKAYKAEVAPPPEPQPSPRQQLQRQVAPGTSKSTGTAPSNSQTQVWTMAEIDRFYTDVTKGAYRDNEAERARIEAEIDQAIIEGRIR